MVTQQGIDQDELAEEILRRFRGDAVDVGNDQDEIAQRILQQFREEASESRGTATILPSPVDVSEEELRAGPQRPVKGRFAKPSGKPRQALRGRVGEALRRVPITPTGLTFEQVLESLKFLAPLGTPARIAAEGAIGFLDPRSAIPIPGQPGQTVRGQLIDQDTRRFTEEMGRPPTFLEFQKVMEQSAPLPPGVRGAAQLVVDPLLGLPLVGPIPGGVEAIRAGARGLERAGAAAREAVPLARPLRTAAAAEGIAKEPWQMTQLEFAQATRTADVERLQRQRITQGVEGPENRLRVRDIESKIQAARFDIEELAKPVAERNYGTQRTFELRSGAHRSIIELAISEGKPIPPEVLAEYPDLMARVIPPEQGGAIQSTMPGVGGPPSQGEMGLGGRIAAQEPVPLIDAEQVAERQRLAAERAAGQAELPEVMPEMVPAPVSPLEQARLGLDEARAMLEGAQARGLPAPKFGTRERAEFDAARRAASAEGRRIIPKRVQVQEARQRVRDAEQSVLEAQEVEKQAFIADNAPDPVLPTPPAPPVPPVAGQPPPIGPRGPGRLGLQFPPEIPPLKGRVQAGKFDWERPDETALQLHFAAITNEERRANVLARVGTESLRGMGMGRLIRGQWVPRPEDIPRLDSLNEALHAPSQVEAGLVRVPGNMEQAYQELRGLMDWESAATLDFDPNMARIQDYWYRGWKPPEGMFVQQRGELVRNPSFRMPRGEATYREMREQGFEPLSWNPYEQWKIRRMQGVKYRQQTELVEFLKGMGEDMIKPHAGGPTPERWRTPKVGPAFEGKPFAFADPVSGDPMIGFTKRWIVRDEMANGLENAYALPPNLDKVMLGERAIDVRSVIDALTFAPKRFKLAGSFFQQADFLRRAGGGSWASMVNALRTGHPVEAVKHVAAYPPQAAEIIGSFFVPQWRQAITQRLDDIQPLVTERPGITVKSVSEAGLNIYDPTAFGRNPLELDAVIREVGQEAVAKKVIKAVPRAFLELERVTRQGLFGGVYPAAIINDVQHNLGPQIIRTYGKNETDGQLSRRIAVAANMRYSSLPATQSVVQNRAVRETLTRVMFSLNETEGLLRQATNALPFGIRFSKKGLPVPTHGGHFQKFWLDHWIGDFLFVIATANLIHYASTGKPLPWSRYKPIAADQWGPLPFGYNQEFAAPDLPLEGRGGSSIMLDIVGQADTAFRVLDPASFVAARQSVPIRAFTNQAKAQDFYRKPIDEEGPGGVYSRTTHLIQDMFAPIGAGQAGLSILAQKQPAVEPFVTFGERKLGTGGQLIQAGGLNVRAESIDAGLRRRYPGFDSIHPALQERLRQELKTEVFGPRTRREKERFQEKLWELFPPKEGERRRFKNKMDKEFGGGEGHPIPGITIPKGEMEELLRQLTPGGRAP